MQVPLHADTITVCCCAYCVCFQNFDSPLGRKSLRRMYDCVVLESPHLPPGVRLMDVYQDHQVSNKQV